MHFSPSRFFSLIIIIGTINSNTALHSASTSSSGFSVKKGIFNTEHAVATQHELGPNTIATLNSAFNSINLGLASIKETSDNIAAVAEFIAPTISELAASIPQAGTNLGKEINGGAAYLPAATRNIENGLTKLGNLLLRSIRHARHTALLISGDIGTQAQACTQRLENITNNLHFAPYRSLTPVAVLVLGGAISYRGIDWMMKGREKYHIINKDKETQKEAEKSGRLLIEDGAKVVAVGTLVMATPALWQTIGGILKR